MIKRTLLLTVIIFCISSNFSLAQLKFNKAHQWSFYNDNAGIKEVNIVALSTGVQLEYVEQGNTSGIPVILLHGYTDSWRSFETLLPFLPETFHAFAISQRGHGNSSRPESNYHPKDFAEDIAAFVKEKNLGAAVIVGHSMGGVIAQQFVLDYPQLTKGIVLVSTDASFKNNPGLPEFSKQIAGLTDPVSYGFVNDFQKGTCAKPIDKTFYRVLVAESLKVPAHVWKAAMYGFMSVDYSAALPEINKPALVIWGDQDLYCSHADQDILLKGIKSAKLLVYEGVGHALHWEESGRFAEDLVNFIKKENR